MAANRTRDVQLNFRVSPHELELIEKKMSQVGTKNREAYLRKMAIDGIVVNLEIPELKELLSLMRYTSNNINQLTRRVHETGRIYDADLEDILQKQDALWNGLKEILTQLGKISWQGYRPHSAEGETVFVPSLPPLFLFALPHPWLFSRGAV